MNKYLKLIIIVLAVFAAAAAGAVIFFTYFNNKNFAPSSVSAGQGFISPFQLSPYVSHSQARANICESPTNSMVKKACQKEYDKVAQDDTEKIDGLFSILDEVKKDTGISDYDKYLAAQVVFASLPSGTSPAAFNIPGASWLANIAEGFLAQAPAGAPRTGMSRAEYEKQLLDDMASVRKNCPSPGYENWTFYAVCAEDSWVNGERQPIYSKEYGETGGPCAFSEAGAVEGYHVQSIVETKLKNEYRFSDASGASNQIACTFTCGSYNCPKLEGQIMNPYCDTKDSTTIYIPHFGYRAGSTSLPANESRVADENVEAECAGRSDDYVLQNDGTTGLERARDCKIKGDVKREWRKDPPDYQAVYYSTYCCSCERPARAPYGSINDFTDPTYTGNDMLKKLLDKAKSAKHDAVPPSKDTTTPPKETPPKETPPEDDSGQTNGKGAETPPLEFTLAQTNFNAKVGERFVYSFCQPSLTRSSDLCAASATNPRHGSPPYRFYLESDIGPLPSGLTFNTNGLLEGTPTAEGSRTVSICAKDTGGSNVCRKATINVAPKPVVEDNPPVEEVEISATVDSTNCEIVNKETFIVDRYIQVPITQYTYRVTASGKARGPVGIIFGFNVDSLDGGYFDSETGLFDPISWTGNKSSRSNKNGSVSRAAGDPATTAWTLDGGEYGPLTDDPDRNPLENEPFRIVLRLCIPGVNPCYLFPGPQTVCPK